ncbi:transcription factor bHLH146 [Juglans microcarpa x Juglans regia]|uniref:transcription factor bHLH146 n=1 Tax=Juglans microcarpa x Juglans regia TaxID=2249226 RepID=UPI001B7F388C|nr:transcription factor bHLH146 [Juglans microcarpa x Juglans regia]
MERQMLTKRRIYSLEPNEKVRAVFARRYVDHLVPALLKINQKILSDENDNQPKDRLEKLVRHEVDMAMVLSADEFAWSRALKLKLQTNDDHHNAGGFTNSSSLHHLTSSHSHYTRRQNNGKISPLPHVSNALIPMKFSQNPNYSKPELKKLITRSTRRSVILRKKDGSEEQKISSSQLKNLRYLLPGGNEMDADDELLKEVGSYITCLELQVNALRFLVENTS